MHVKFLECISCRKIYSDKKIHFRCTCGSALEIVYDYKKIRRKVSWKKFRSRKFNHWRYRELFPVSGKSIITMNEGGTPLIRSKYFGKILGFNLFFKLEGLNPTGSFKDRGTTVEISKVLEYGAKKVYCASTGNMGASVAAYSSLAGIKAEIFVPGITSKAKLKQMEIYGAKIKKVSGDYTAALQAAAKAAGKGYMMGDYPFRGEGEKSVGYEIIDELNYTDYIITPVGNGTLIHSAWKGIVELKEIGLAKKLPRMIGIQAEGCSTVSKAFRERRNYIKKIIPRTSASAIACGFPLDGVKALNAIRKSNGTAETVSDKEMLRAKQILASKEGIYSELSGAAPLAGLFKIRNKIPNKSRIVLVITGHGLKDS
jgi:threonine synthase